MWDKEDLDINTTINDWKWNRFKKFAPKWCNEDYNIFNRICNDDKSVNLKELKKCMIDEYQDLYQNFNRIHINYDNILNHKLPKIFYDKVEDILGKYNTPLGLDIFDKLAKLPNLSEQEILHIKLAKMIYIRNFKILKESIKEKK